VADSPKEKRKVRLNVFSFALQLISASRRRSVRSLKRLTNPYAKLPVNSHRGEFYEKRTRVLFFESAFTFCFFDVFGEGSGRNRSDNL
jgi:hypothetical protein